MKNIDRKEIKTLIAPIIATLFIFLNVIFGIEVPAEDQATVLYGITNIVLICIVLYGIWHNHDKDCGDKDK